MQMAARQSARVIF